MRKSIFLAACLSLGIGISGSLYAQNALQINQGATVTSIGGTTLQVRGDTYAKGIVSEEGALLLKPNSSTDFYGSVEMGYKGAVKIHSDASGTASVIAHKPNGSETVISHAVGGYYSQRYINNDAKWHYFTAPVSQQTISKKWVTDNHIAFASDATPALDFWRWNEKDSKWKRYDYQGGAGFDGGPTEFTSGDGFIAAVKPDGSKSIPVGTLEFEGKTFNNDDADVTVSNAGANSTTPGSYHCWKGWNLVGNPFPSAYNIKDWLTSTATEAELADHNHAVYIFVEGSVVGGATSGNFLSVTDYQIISGNGFDSKFKYYDADGNLVVSGSFASLGQDYVAPGQGFFVRLKEGATGPLNFPAQHRAHKFNADAAYRTHDQEDSWPGFMLMVNNGKKEITGTLVSFDDAMTPALDPSCDVAALEVDENSEFSKNINIYTQMVEGDYNQKMAQQALPWNMPAAYQNNGETGYEIPVGVEVKTPSNLTFDIFQRHLDAEKLVLEDRALGVFTDLNTDVYATTFSPEENGIGRFFMHVGSNNTMSIVNNTDLQMSVYAIDKMHLKVLNPAAVVGDYHILDMNGHLLNTGHLTGNTEQTVNIDLATGMYMFKVNTAHKTQSFKFINK